MVVKYNQAEQLARLHGAVFINEANLLLLFYQAPDVTLACLLWLVFYWAMVERHDIPGSLNQVLPLAGQYRSSTWHQPLN